MVIHSIFGLGGSCLLQENNATVNPRVIRREWLSNGATGRKEEFIAVQIMGFSNRLYNLNESVVHRFEEDHHRVPDNYAGQNYTD